MNLESYWVRGTIEIRAAAGTVEFEKIAHWADLTQRLITRSCSARGYRNFSEGIDNLTMALAKGSAPQVEMVEVQEQVTSSGWIPKHGTRYYWLYQQLVHVEHGWYRDQLAALMADELSLRHETAKLYITDFLGEARRQGLTIERSGGRHRQAEILRLVEVEGGTRMVTRMVARPVQATEPAQDDAAIAWLKKRHDKFAPRHQVAI
jgi:hypothetical protein